VGDGLHAPAKLAATLMLIATGCNFQPYVLPGATASYTPIIAEETSVIPSATSGATTPNATATRGASGTSAPGALSATPASPSSEQSPTPCTDHAEFVEDVTIRDNTLVMPGAGFVKIWRLRNIGTCVWDPTYATVFIGGERLEASSPVHLTTTVIPGATVDVAVDLVAPETPGTYQGYWKLVSRGGNYFGLGAEADAAFWVKIVVPALPTETGVATPTPTPTATTTPKPTPETVASGSTTLELDMSLDLDTGQHDPTSGSDISLNAALPGPPSLVPAEGALVSRYGPPPDPPTPSRCQALNLSEEPIPLSSLSVQGLVCYRTSEGRLGYLRVRSLDDGLGLSFVTWGP
jgi:hypothetical protein